MMDVISGRVQTDYGDEEKGEKKTHPLEKVPFHCYCTGPHGGNRRGDRGCCCCCSPM
jgi:hypothetical protein